jgi:hypothetical protein
MGILILGALVVVAVGMGIGTFAAHKLGIHEGVGQVAGLALVGLAAFLWLKADDRKRAQAVPPPAATVSAATAGHASGGSTHAALEAPASSETLVAEAASAQADASTPTDPAPEEADTLASTATGDEALGDSDQPSSTWGTEQVDGDGDASAVLVAESDAGEQAPASSGLTTSGFVSAFD